MQIPCNVCKKLQEPYMVKETEEVFCTECNNPLQVTHFAKVQIKTLKLYKEKTKTPFSVKCNSCNKEGKPILIKDDACCFSCKKPLNVNMFFKQMLKTIKSSDI